MPNPGSKIKTYRPTMEEFKNFNLYVKYIESDGGHKGGVCKIIPPKEWKARLSSYDDVDNFKIPSPITQHTIGNKGLYSQCNMVSTSMNVGQFRKMCNSARYSPPAFEDYDSAHREYWRSFHRPPPIYGADISGSLFDKRQNVWNVAKLGSILDLVEENSGIKIEGVNTSYLYFGMWRSTFSWHTEDMDLHSINYLHFGAPKFWYAVPPEHGKRLEQLIENFFPQMHGRCKAFIRHKQTIVSPKLLEKHGIPYDKVVQEAGDFMITFPYGYHCGYNLGFNCAESTNFANERWISYGKAASRCTCSREAVSINMDSFVKIFQPDEYESWKKNPKDIKINHTWCPPAPDFNAPYVSWRDKVKSFIAAENKKNGTNKTIQTPSSEFKKSQRKGKGSRKLLPLEPKPSSSRKKATENKLEDIISMSDDIHSILQHEKSSTLYDRIKSRARSGSDTSPLKEDADNSEVVPKTTKRRRGRKPLLKNRKQKKVRINFEEEMKMNELASKKAPYCTVCCLLRLKLQRCQPLSTYEYSVDARGIAKSEVLIPELNFSMSHNDPDPEGMTFQLESTTTPKISCLMKCSKCRVQVHTSCYGVSDAMFLDCARRNPSLKWYCNRCRANAKDAICCLCYKQAGALKSVGNRPGKWAHVSCTLALPDAYFESTSTRERIMIKDKCKENDFENCCYCNNADDENGMSVQCCSTDCSNIEAFHITCATENNHYIEEGNWPDSIYTFCSKCSEDLPYGQLNNEGVAPTVKVGDEVTALNENDGRYYPAHINDIKNVEFHKVAFEDSTFSNNLFQEDIINHDWSKPPAICSKVQVKWSDNVVYSANYKGSNPSKVYMVVYSDGGVGEIQRHELFSIKEKIPRRISKLVVSIRLLSACIYPPIVLGRQERT